MKLRNTLTKSVDEFVPIDKLTARIYSCGPTVYNHAHIGNLSAYIYADTLRRVVKLAGYQTNHVMNFTDVDDKTIRDSRIKYPDLEPMMALMKFTEFYEQVFLDEMRAVGNDTSAITFTKATDNIAKIQRLINRLLEQGIAYVADDGIYFSVDEYRKTRVYGQLSYINDKEACQARIVNDEYDKGTTADFALWKQKKPGEPAWGFQVNGQNMAGRPGWHIECSVMSTDHLGQPFDIHTGGIDLIFPHHENEIAQSTAGDQPAIYARFFVHNEHLLVDGKKMSKSAHNFYTLPDIIERGYEPLDFRMLILQSHYRSPSNFGWDNLTAARNRRLNWNNIAALRWQNNESTCGPNDDLDDRVSGLIAQASQYLEDDLDTPNALRVVDQAINLFNGRLAFNRTSLISLINFIDQALGLNLAASTPDITPEQRDMITDRVTAKRAKDFAKADNLRDQLLSQSIELLDTRDGVIWQRR